MSAEKQENLKSIKTNYFYNLVYEVFALLVPLITTPYVSRVLGADGVGTYSFTYSIAQYFVIFGNLGVSTYGQMAIAAARNDRKKVSQIFYELWILRFFSMLFSLGIYLVVTFLSKEFREARLILSIFVFASIFDLTWLFRGIEDFARVVIRNFIIKIGMIVMIFAFVNSRDDVNLYIFFVAFSTLLGNVSFLFSLRGVLVRVPIRELNLMRHCSECIVYFIPTIATSVYTLLDKTMLGYILKDTTQSGYYEQAHKIEQILITLITSLNIIMRSRMAFLYKEKRYQEMRERLDRSISFILLLSVAMCFGLIGVAKTFIPLFLGNGFEPCVLLLQIFSTLLIFIGLSNCINTHFLGPSGRQDKNNVVLIMGALVNFVFNWIAIPKFGAIGAAVASAIAELLILIGYLYLARDFFPSKKIFRFGWRYLIAGLSMLFVVNQFDQIHSNNFLVLIVQIALGAATFLGVTFLLRDPFVWNNAKKLWEKLH